MTSENAALVGEKLDQAVDILQELDIDVWLTFVRETMLTPDPSLDLILGFDMVWQSAFIITKTGERIAIVGTYDAEDVRNTGGYTRVETYVEGVSAKLVEILTELNPRQIAVNYSENDVAADGLGHGLMLLLQRYLNGTDLVSRFISAEKIIDALRGRKSPIEVSRMKTAIATTQGIFKAVTQFAEVGFSETKVADYAHGILTEKGLGTAWDWAFCPTVNCGPDSPVGHAGPQDRFSLQPGTLMHMDFGVKENGYCADLQRVWYVRRAGETQAPPELQEAFTNVRKALLAGFAALKPGVLGWQVDEIARATLVSTGFPEYKHAFGHHLGRAAHDGATVLGPRWERYGDTPNGVVAASNVFAIELGAAVDGFGYIGLEENVIVTENGAEWLSVPQSELWLI